MIRRLAFILLFVMLVLVSSCEDGKTPTPKPPAPATTAAEVNDRNVRNLCEFFYFRAHETLLMPEAHGNAKLYAERAGVPAKLKAAVMAYYEGSLQLPRDRPVLDKRYAAVITACQEAGWKP